MYYASETLAMTRAAEFAAMSGMAYAVWETFDGMFETMAAGLRYRGMTRRLVATVTATGEATREAALNLRLM